MKTNYARISYILTIAESASIYWEDINKAFRVMLYLSKDGGHGNKIGSELFESQDFEKVNDILTSRLPNILIGWRDEKSMYPNIEHILYT